MIGWFAVRNLLYGPIIKITLLALPYNKYLINLVCSIHTASYGSSFFSTYNGPLTTCSCHKAVEKNSVHNLWYGPHTWLIRAMNLLVIPYILVSFFIGLYCFVWWHHHWWKKSEWTELSGVTWEWDLGILSGTTSLSFITSLVLYNIKILQPDFKIFNPNFQATVSAHHQGCRKCFLMAISKSMHILWAHAKCKKIKAITKMLRGAGNVWGRILSLVLGVYLFLAMCPFPVVEFNHLACNI